ncbi:hypothetical protein [Paludisphaera borealis]|uniref:Uncharacterized protein n=1 Tax=Paludisphaera borealis TaxID=1387353 RepID=A0A1U7CRJ1_9BACT|nr:hypothetical protein [Paludisphaera borealis]APW61551.1 hypothetical protein BSF38_03069 [Paludisphaera borealis]
MSQGGRRPAVQRLGVRLKLWWLMAAVAVAAVLCAVARKEGSPIAGAVIVGTCVLVLAYKRFSEALALRRSEGLTTSRPRKVWAALNAVCVAVMVIGLSDLAFLVGYSGYMALSSRSSHWSPYDDEAWIAMGAAAGTTLAVRVAVALRRRFWPQRPPALRRSNWLLEFACAVTALVISRLILR